MHNAEFILVMSDESRLARFLVTSQWRDARTVQEFRCLHGFRAFRVFQMFGLFNTSAHLLVFLSRGNKVVAFSDD